jgi:predicted GNAT family acetyltransferase
MERVSDSLQVIDNQAQSRFEVADDGELAELVYRRHGDRLVLVHTEVPESLGGRGIGSLLVQAAVDLAEAEQLTVVPQCPFARRWLERHEDQATRITIDWPKARP